MQTKLIREVNNMLYEWLLDNEGEEVRVDMLAEYVTEDINRMGYIKRDEWNDLDHLYKNWDLVKDLILREYGTIPSELNPFYELDRVMAFAVVQLVQDLVDFLYEEKTTTISVTPSLARTLHIRGRKWSPQMEVLPF